MGECNDVMVVDNNVEFICCVIEMLDVNGIVGYVFYLDVLEWVGVCDVDMIIVVIYLDEVNMVIC